MRKQAGVWLKARRRAAGLTQKELARKVGLEYYPVVSQFEGAQARLPSSQYAKWAEALGLDLKAFAATLLGYYDPHTFAALELADSPPRRRDGDTATDTS